MKKKKNPVALLLHWAGGQKFWLFLSVLLSLISGLCTMIPYIGIYQLMEAGFTGTCTKEIVMKISIMIAIAVTLRFAVVLVLLLIKERMEHYIKYAAWLQTIWQKFL